MLKKLIFGICLFTLGTQLALSSSPGLEVVIRTEKAEYKRGDRISLEATLKNKTEKNLILFWSLGIPSVTKTGRAEENKPVPVTISTSPSLSPEVKRIYIKRREEAKKTVSFSTAGWEAGTYQLTLEYTSPNVDLKTKLSPDDDIFTETAVSNTVGINISRNILY